jgi:hypothetical protein
MDIAPANAPVSAKGRAKVIKSRDGTEVAARHFVYKLYEATDGRPMQWQVLLGLGESAATISRAVEHGRVIRQDVQGKPLDRKAALTDEGGAWPAREDRTHAGVRHCALRKITSAHVV